MAKRPNTEKPNPEVIWFGVIVAEFIVVALINYYFNDFALTFFSVVILLLADGLFHPNFREIKHDYAEFVNLLITLVTTVFGVYFALVLTNNATEKDEKQNVISILNSGTRILNQAQHAVEGRMQILIDRFENEPDSLFVRSRKRLQQMHINTFIKPSIVRTILNSESALKYLHDYEISQLVALDDNLENMYQGLNSKYFESPNKMLFYVRRVSWYLYLSKEYFAQQALLLKGDISEENFKDNLKIQTRRIDSLMRSIPIDNGIYDPDVN